MQSRLMSGFEAACNVAIGYAISVTANILILPLFGLPVSVGQAAKIAVAFTAIALVRSYLVRRLFNGFPRCRWK